MKKNVNETNEEFEERKRQRIIKIIVGGTCFIITLGMIAYTAGVIWSMKKNDFKKFAPVKKIEETEDRQSRVLKKTL